MLHRLFSRLDDRVFHDVNHAQHPKRALICYITYPFWNPIPTHAHQSHWQVKELARIVGTFGYTVDVINYNSSVQLSHAYDLVIDIHPSATKSYWGHLQPNAKKIVYYTGSYPDFQNRAEKQRLDALYQRRGVRLQARRQVEPISKSVWNRFDAILLMGNEQTKKTFPTLSVPIHRIPNTADELSWTPDFTHKSNSSFVFLASGGQVHKGLDLLLEIFPKHQQLELFVCSPFDKETDFTTLYRKELFETPNIHPVGFVNVRSRKFEAIANTCRWMIYPSASEGMAGSVLTAIAAGLVPIVSKESGVTHGVHLFNTTTLSTIEKTIVLLSQRKTGQPSVDSTLYSRNEYSMFLRTCISAIIR